MSDYFINTIMSKWFRFRKRDNCFYIGDWYCGWHSWLPCLTYNECGYDTANAELHISLFGWYSIFKLPWKSKRFSDGDCMPPEYGIQIHNSYFWLELGGNGNMGGGDKTISWQLPFTFDVCCRHDIECNINGEIKMVPAKELGDCYWDSDKINRQIYDFTDNYDGTKLKATIYAEEREWRRKWLQWTSLFNDVKKSIEIEFSEEVGPRKGSWKGGILGTSCEILPGESPLDALRRYENTKRK